MPEPINVLGCVPKLLNIQCELLFEQYGITEFNIVKNIPQAIKDEFKKDDLWSVNFFNAIDRDAHIPSKNNCVFGVVGCNSKREVFNFFKNTFGIDKDQYINSIHPSSYISKSSILGSGIMVEQQVIISSMSKFGFGVNIKRACNIGHHCTIGDFVTINPGVSIGGRVQIKKGTSIGIGSVIKDGISIGQNVIIGMGSVVTADIPDNMVAYGNPCKLIREND